MSTVVAFVDDSEAAQPVLRAALAVAPIFGATVDAVHVREGARSTATLAAAHRDVPLRIVEGEVTEVLLAEAGGADRVALVVGTSGGHLRRGRSAGSRACALADRVPIPVLAVPPDAAVPERFERVLVAMKGTPRNAKHLRRAVETAVGADLEVVVVHVDDERTIPSFSDHAQYDVEAYAQEFLERYTPGLTVARLELRIGDPVEQILATAAASGVDVIAAGFASGREDEPPGVVDALLERSPIPVLLVTLR
jgi:nucleotide-binding universal stress UspA family protein